MNPLILSLQVASSALVLIIITGLLVNYIMKNVITRGHNIIDSFLTLPLVLPPVVVGFGLLMLFSPGYAFGHFLGEYGIRFVFTKAGAIAATYVVAFPLFYTAVKGALETTDPVIEDVARTLGASEWRIFWTISVPLAWRGIFTGAVLSFCRALGEFGATIMVAGNIPGITETLPLSIYTAVEAGKYADAFTYVMYICVLTLTLLWGINYIVRGGVFGKSKGGSQ